MECNRKRDGRWITECRPPHGHVSRRSNPNVTLTAGKDHHESVNSRTLKHISFLVLFVNRYAASIDDILEEEEHYADQLKEYFFYTDAVRSVVVLVLKRDGYLLCIKPNGESLISNQNRLLLDAYFNNIYMRV